MVPRTFSRGPQKGNLSMPLKRRSRKSSRNAPLIPSSIKHHGQIASKANPTPIRLCTSLSLQKPLPQGQKLGATRRHQKTILEKELPRPVLRRSTAKNCHSPAENPLASIQN
jgi:hypothetical protein